MKKLSLFLITALLFCCCTNKYVIEGITSVKDGESVFLFTFTNSGWVNSVDTAVIKKGKFRFEGEPYLNNKSLIVCGNYPNKVKSAGVILEKGKIEIYLDSISVIRGTHFNNLLQAINDSITRISNNGKSKMDYVKHTIKENINNPIGRTLLMENIHNIGDYNLFNEIYENSDTTWRKNEVIQEYKEFLSKISELEKKREKLTGKAYKDFEFITPTGEKKKLSDYVGTSKFLLIDLWASWCGPCIEDIPNWKRLYSEQNKKDFEIVSISMDQQKKAWVRAMEKHQMPWTQLLMIADYKDEFKEWYGLLGIPHYTLLNHEGKIVAHNFGFDIIEQIITGEILLE